MDAAVLKLSSSTPSEGTKPPQPIDSKTLSLEQLRDLSSLSAAQAMRLAPEDMLAKVNQLATQYSCLIMHKMLMRSMSKRSSASGESDETSPNRSLSKHYHLTLPSVIN